MAVEKKFVRKLIDLTNAGKLDWKGDRSAYLVEYSGGVIQLFFEGGHYVVQVEGINIREADLDFDGSLEELNMAIVASSREVKRVNVPMPSYNKEYIQYVISELDKLGQ